MCHAHRTRRMKPSRQSLTAALACSALVALAVGCAEAPQPEPVVDEQPTTFEVTTTIELDQSNLRDALRLDRVYLGIGSVLLEPLDDLDAPLVSNRQPTALRYELHGTWDGTADAAPLELERPGRYLISLAVQPVDDDLWKEDAPSFESVMNESDSIRMDGHYFSVTGPDVSSPEPVPWRTRTLSLSTSYDVPDMFESGRVRDYPFTYRSSRTGYIRVGEVYLGAEQNHIQIRVNLEGWLDTALSPTLAEAVSSPSASTATQLDVSTRLEASGLGLERLFRFSEAESF